MSAGRETTPAVTVVVVNWNGSRFLEPLVASLLATEYERLDVLVVDNASTDGSRGILERLASRSSRVRLLALDTNTGYAGGGNAGLRHLPDEARYVGFLNSDVVVDRNWLRPLVGFLEDHPDVGIVQPKLLKLSDPGRLDRAAVFVDRLGYDAYNLFTDRRDGPDLDAAKEVFSVSGAAFLARRSVLDAVAFDGSAFDPAYFTYFEETDLCWRARLAGRRVWYVPASRVHHLRGGATRPNGRLPPVLVFHHTKNRLAALLKNYNTANLALWFPMLFLLEALRAVATRLTSREHFLAIVQAQAWVLAPRKELRARRAFVQRHVRQVGDREATALMAVPNPPALLRNYWALYHGPRSLAPRPLGPPEPQK